MDTEDFLEVVVNEQEPDRLWAAGCHWLESMGFDRVLHLSIPGQGPVTARTTLGAEFEQAYKLGGWARCDPFLTYCLPARQSLATGADYLDDYGYLEAAERQVILAARETGFRAGFSLVTRRDARQLEAWNIGSTLRRREVELIREAHETKLRLGLAALRDRLTQAAPVGLSPREVQCLDLLGEGLRVKAIATELDLAEVTVEMHLKNARQKLGAATREQALLRYHRQRS